MPNSDLTKESDGTHSSTNLFYENQYCNVLNTELDQLDDLYS